MDGYRDTSIDLMMRFADAGFSVHTPVFFDLSGLNQTAAAVVGFSRICVSREFHVLTTKGDSPAAAWVRDLAQHLSNERGRKVGVVGMCFTGGLALAAIANDGVGAAVVAQPAMPFANGPRPLGSEVRRRSFGLSAAEETAVMNSSTPILALRFDRDSMSPRERVIEIDSFAAGCAVWVRDANGSELEGHPHPTLTAAFRDTKETIAQASETAISRVVDFLHANLGSGDVEDR